MNDIGAGQPASLELSFDDDPRVVAEQARDDYATHVVPLTARLPRWKLTMASWALLSALFYLYISVTIAQNVGSADALIGMMLAVILYGSVNAFFTRRAIDNGLTVGLLSRRIFGRAGAILASLIFGVTTIYYAVFEGSIIAVALQHHLAPASDLRIWYLVTVIYALPLVAGGVQKRLDRVNGWLLPLYVIGLAALVVAAGVQHGFSTEFLRLPPRAELSVPGWLWAFCVYLGVVVNVMVAVDYSRFGRPEDKEFHSWVTFGPLFNFLIFVVDGLAGIFLMATAFPGLDASESGVADAILSLGGGLGLLFIVISQTRINTANYYLASINLEGFAARAFGVRWPRLAWVAIAGILVFAMMLTNVFSYLLTALAWQGVAVTAWVAIAGTHLALHRAERHGPEFRSGRVPAVLPGAGAWAVATLFGIALLQFGQAGSWYVVSAPLLIAVMAAVLYVAIDRSGGTRLLRQGPDLRDEVRDPWRTWVKCHACQRSYIAIEMDRNPASEQQAICAGCAEADLEYLEAARNEARAARRSARSSGPDTPSRIMPLRSGGEQAETPDISIDNICDHKQHQLSYDGRKSDASG